MNARLSPDIVRNTGGLPVPPQAAALCYRIAGDAPDILLITTRRSGRWIIPKGWPIDGMSAAETAAQEAWEEAGVIGKCSPNVLGRFTYHKKRPDEGAALCLVDVFPLRVKSQARDFPERGERKFKWCSAQTASLCVNSPDLAGILREFGAFPH